MEYINMDIYDELYSDYKSYIESNSKFSPTICKKTPQTIAKFPTIKLRESININDKNTFNNIEVVDQLAFKIDIYTKDKVVDDTMYASESIMKELKYLTFTFFNALGMTRIACDDAPYVDINVDRISIVYKCKINNWNKNII